MVIPGMILKSNSAIALSNELGSTGFFVVFVLIGFHTLSMIQMATDEQRSTQKLHCQVTDRRFPLQELDHVAND